MSAESVDREALKRRRQETEQEMHRLGIGLFAASAPAMRLTFAETDAIIADLERHERVEKAARAMRRWQGEMWRMGVLAQQDIDALIAALAPAPADEVVHMAPSVNKTVTPCCGRTPFELRATDRMTLDQARVTCRGAVPVEEGSGG